MKPNTRILRWLTAASILLVVGCSSIRPTVGPTPTDLPSGAHINAERLYQTLNDITGIQAYSGWRTSATLGESEAFDLLSARLGDMNSLKSNGLEITRDAFRVFLATEIHQTSLVLSSRAGRVTVPVNGLRGSRDNVQSALRLDSDGVLNDTNLDPVTVSGTLTIVRNGTSPNDLASGSLKGKILLIEYAWVDIVINSGEVAHQRIQAALKAQPDGIILATQYSNQPGISHGTYLADLGIISTLTTEPAIPTMFMRMEDLPEGGADPWKTLANFGTAELTWDTDVLSPGTSGNLIARIPGKDHERGVLISAHIDSANTPGALDDGSGSAILLEVAAALNEANVTPEYDLYLVWYGSEELGLLGSANFTASHQEIVDRLIGMLNIDCLSRPVDGAPATLNFAYGSGMQPGDTDDPWVNYLSDRAEGAGIDIQQVYMPLASDNSSFAGYDVPNLDMIYDSDEMMDDFGGVWFAGHLHDPYDETGLVREVDEQFLDMAEIALDTATLPLGVPEFNQNASSDARVLIVASHTEDVLLTPAGLFDMGLAFENAGLDVDVVPYGTELTASDLDDVNLVIALPVFDLPSGDPAQTSYDEAWSSAEIELLKGFVEGGGTLVITNTAHRVKYYNTLYEANEDWAKVNTLANEFGVTYETPKAIEAFTSEISKAQLTEGIAGLYWFQDNAVPFSIPGGDVLATAGGHTVLGEVKTGSGNVIVLADIGMLASIPDGLFNPRLVQNLIDYAQE